MSRNVTVNGEHKYGRLAKDRLKQALLKEGASPEYAEKKAIESALRSDRRREINRNR